MKTRWAGVVALGLLGCVATPGGGVLAIGVPNLGTIGPDTVTSTIPNRGERTTPVPVYPREVWTVDLVAGTPYTVLMCSRGTAPIDPYLSVTPPDGTTEDPHFDDDSAGNFNSRVVLTPTVSGTYTIYATVFSMLASDAPTGSYLISVVTGALTSSACQ